MNSGYLVGGVECYCSDECLYKTFTKEARKEMYYTDWEDDEYAVNIINEINNGKKLSDDYSDKDQDTVTQYMEDNDYAFCMKCNIIFATEDDGGKYLDQADYLCAGCIEAIRQYSDLKKDVNTLLDYVSDDEEKDYAEFEGGLKGHIYETIMRIQKQI